MKAGAEPDIHLRVRPGERGNDFWLHVRSPQHMVGLARLVARLVVQAARHASRMELRTLGNGEAPGAWAEAELAFSADKRELTKWQMGALRREALLQELSGSE